jgi:hypothetical protein
VLSVQFNKPMALNDKEDRRVSDNLPFMAHWD